MKIKVFFALLFISQLHAARDTEKAGVKKEVLPLATIESRAPAVASASSSAAAGAKEDAQKDVAAAATARAAASVGAGFGSSNNAAASSSSAQEEEAIKFRCNFFKRVRGNSTYGATCTREQTIICKVKKSDPAETVRKISPFKGAFFFRSPNTIRSIMVGHSDIIQGLKDKKTVGDFINQLPVGCFDAEIMPVVNVLLPEFFNQTEIRTTTNGSSHLTI